MHTVTLKNLKHSEFASHETHCFEATVYVDGKKLGIVSNDGQGGPNCYHPNSMEPVLSGIASALPPIQYSSGDTVEVVLQCADVMIGDLVDRALEARQLKRHCSRQTLFRKPGESYNDGEYSTLKTKYGIQAKAYLVAKYGKDVFILNESI